MNDASFPLMDAATVVTGQEATAAHREFRESRWVAWNWFRTVANLGALVGLTLVG